MSRKWVYAMATLLLANAIGIVGFGIIAGSPPLEPTICERAIQYVARRFDTEVETGAPHMHLHGLAPVKALLHQGRGVGAFIEGG